MIKSLNFFISLIICFVASLILLLSAAYIYLEPHLPSIEHIKETPLQIPLRIYTADEKLIGEFGEKKRSPIPFSKVPQPFIHALLAAEDSQFYSHPGVNLKSLMRSLFEMAKKGKVVTGGSTLTMQLARNYFLGFERRFVRKFNEIILALQIERLLTKEEILELYVNKIFLGKGAYGIEAAAQVYYGKSISELNLAQFAMLAGVPKAPTAYNPINKPQRALKRRNWILSRMHQLGYIPDHKLANAILENVSASIHGAQIECEAPYVAEQIRKDMVNRYGEEEAYSKGYKAYASIDCSLQKAANRALINGLHRYDERHGYKGVLDNIQAIDIKEVHPVEKQALSAVDSPKPLLFNEGKLRDYPLHGPLQLGIVTQVYDEKIDVLNKKGELFSLLLSQFDWAREHIEINHLSSEIINANQVFKPGDVIYLRPQQEEAVKDNEPTDENIIKTPQLRLAQIPAIEGALIALDPMNGRVLAWVGGYDFKQSNFDRALQADRQIGSSFKPIIYTAALENGYTPATVINDAPVTFEDGNLESTWRPENSSGRFYGPTRLRQALYNSRNLVSIRMLRDVGIKKTISTAKRLGLSTKKLPKDLSLALGSSSMTPLEVASLFGIFANGGYEIEPYFINSIKDKDENLLYRAIPLTICTGCDPKPDDNQTSDYEEGDRPIGPKYAKRVLDQRVAYIMDHMLEDVINKGTGRKAKALNRNDLRGKTGTTNDQMDAWFTGYTHQIVATIWAGFDQPSSLGKREYGATVALPIWIDFMQEALKEVPEVTRKRPSGLVTIRINKKTGKPTLPEDKDAVFEIFRQELAPKLKQNNKQHVSEENETVNIF